MTAGWVVHKNVFARFADRLEWELPEGSVPLSAGEQFGAVAVWARRPLASPSRMSLYRFEMYGTGHPMPLNTGYHLGTVLMQGGALVLHVFWSVTETPPAASASTLDALSVRTAAEVTA